MTFRRTRATFAALAHPNVERFHADIRDAARVEHAECLSAPLFDAAMTKSAAWRRYTSVCVYGRPALRPSVVMRWNVQPNWRWPIRPAVARWRRWVAASTKRMA